MRRISDLYSSNFFVRESFRVLLSLVLLVAALPSFGAELSIQYEVVARSGITPIPGGVGNFTVFGPESAIDSNGNVVFLGGGGYDNNGKAQGGVYTFIGGQHQKVADYNTLIPGGGGATFTQFSSVDKNDIDNGRVAFTANTISPGTQLGLYSNVGQASPDTLFEVALVDGIEWGSKGDPWVDGDVVAMLGQRLIPDTYDTILRKTGSSLSENFVSPGAGYLVGSGIQTSISGSATVFGRYHPQTGAGGLVISNGGVIEPLVELNTTTIPDHAGATFSNVGAFPVIDNGGMDAAFTGIGGTDARGVYKRINLGSLEQVVDTTMIAPGSNSQEFRFFHADGISLANGQMVFVASGTNFLDGIYTDIGGALSVIVDDQTNNIIEIDGQTKQITAFDLNNKSFAYTSNGYEVVFWVQFQSGETAIIKATVNSGGTNTAPNISVSGSGAFGDVEVDTTSNLSFSVSNSGNAALTINSIGGLAAPFSIVSNNCGSSLAAGTSCTFDVQFAPTEATGETDTVMINSDDPDQPNVNIDVSGTGTAVPVPNIAVSGSGSFGNVEVDTTSNLSFSVSNSGNAALTINSIGGLAAPFSIVSNNCGSSLAAGTSCTFDVQFAPTEATGETDTVMINSDDPDQPNVNIDVSGTGTAVPVPNIAVSGSGSFGNVEVDTTSNLSFSVSNSGNAALTINSIGGLAAPFSIVSNNCGSSLAAGTSCTFNVQFAPTAATGETDTVKINSDDPDQPNVNIDVSGTGTAVPVPNIAVSGSGSLR